MIEEKDDLFVCLIEDIHNNVKEIEIIPYNLWHNKIKTITSIKI